VILRELARFVGRGKLVVATVASERPSESWDRYESILRGLGVRHLAHLQVESRRDAESPRALAALEDAAAVFFTGGDQLRITSLVGDTPVFSRCYEILAHGGTIAGTSAGAAVMSEVMIVSGNGDQSRRIDSSLQLAPGFGFAKDLVIDQHFAERGRLGRLLGIVAQNPRVLGIGIDENTAVELQPNRRFRVFGGGAVYVIDGKDVLYSNIAREDGDRAMSIFGVRLHVLTQSDEFDLRHRLPKARPAEQIEKALDGAKANGRSNGNGARRRTAH
jgi:cyanophycinase